ncbi:beta-ketoacyl synthase [Acidipropionibacterium jensenii]|uniref:beta-ketoacyl synthase n=1 Tax=Acidipropionibacterium jensenii TaxID=1749 RepID=UPI000BC35431|nr:beta-ketoacyl synthase [Acidipropionibacterium jensenii]AZZ42389.1 beta-ketoacyl synthase [Acidipropionibacterium jensenii]
MTRVFDDEETVALSEGVHLELPATLRVRARGSKMSWTVLAGDQIIGRLDRWITGRGLRFYAATAYHPTTGTPIRLEASSDMAERIELILRAWHDPESYTPHSPW